MSEPTHLIPNLNEMMVAYTKVEEETVQKTQSREMQAEERTEDRGEPGQLGEESRKRKRGAEKVRSLISDKAAALMEKSLKDRAFIVERGFRKLISLFAEMLERMAITRRAQRTRLCCVGERIFCEHGGRGRKESVCQRTMDRLQQREDKYIVQSKGVERWFKVQETTEEARVSKDSKPTYSQERKMERYKENPLQIHC